MNDSPEAASAPDAAPELFTWEFATDPYPAYAWLREHAPRAPDRTAQRGRGLAGHPVRGRPAGPRRPRLSKNPAHHDEPAHAKGKTGIPGERKAELMTHLLNIDPPDHTRLRRLVSQGVHPAPGRRIRAPGAGVDRPPHRRGSPSEGRTADLIHEFAFPLPIYAICDLLGVPREDQDDFRDWAGMMIRHGGGPRGGVARSVKKMRGYLAELIHRKRETRARGDEDLISGLIRASDHGEHLTENEAAAMAFILLFAGFETTVNLIGNGTYALLRHPAQRDTAPEVAGRGRHRAARHRRRGTAALRRPGGAGHLAVRHPGR